MYLSRQVDEREILLKRQNRIFFQINGVGHEAVLAAAAKVLRPSYDWFYPYYRDRALCLGLGMTPLEMFLSAVAAEADPKSGGRQMPSHWGHRNLHIEEIDGCDPVESHSALSRAAAWCRARKGPGFVHAHVIRPYSHSLSDDERLYRPQREREADAKKDPIVRFVRSLIDQGVASEEMLAEMRRQVDREVAEASDRALESPRPSPSTVTL